MNAPRITSMEGNRHVTGDEGDCPRTELISDKGWKTLMPNRPRPDNRAHTVRVPDPLWEKSLARAAERGETVSEAVRKFLERYTK